MNWLERIIRKHIIRIREFEKEAFEDYRKKVEGLTRAIIDHFGQIPYENWQEVERWLGEIYPPGFFDSLKALPFYTHPFYVYFDSNLVLTKTVLGKLPFYYWINEINLETDEVLPFFANIGPFDFLFIRKGNDEQGEQSLSAKLKLIRKIPL